MRTLPFLFMGFAVGTAFGRYIRGDFSFWVLLGLTIFACVMVGLTWEPARADKRK